MGIWDFVKDAGKSVFGSEAEAAEPKAQPNAGAAKPAAGAAKPSAQEETDRKVAALKAELRKLGLDKDDVHLTLKGDTVKIVSKGADRETMEKLILAVGNIKGIAKVEAEVPKAPAGTQTASTAEGKPAAAGEPVFHKVKSGDTLSAIAKKYLGNANRYNDIFEANKPMLKSADEIYPGQVLRIPAA